MPIGGQTSAVAQADGTVLVTGTVRNTGTRAATFGISCLTVPDGVTVVSTIAGRYDRATGRVCARRSGTIPRGMRITAAVRVRACQPGARVRMTGSLARASADPRLSGPLWAVTRSVLLP